MLRVLLAVVLAGPAAAALVTSPQLHSQRSMRSMRAQPPAITMNWFANAFANDDTLGERKSAGLSKEAQKVSVTWVGPRGQKKTSVAVPGQKLRDVARATGIPIRYDCNEGTCKTCEAMVGRGRAKICVTKVPNKDVDIKYNVRF